VSDTLYDDYVRVQDGRRVCLRCYHYSRHLEDGYCPRCNGEAETDLEARQREAARRGARQTAAYLRRMGHPGEALIHEEDVR
jgi:uncharacterized paraquat-inducible protein A